METAEILGSIGIVLAIAAVIAGPLILLRGLAFLIAHFSPKPKETVQIIKEGKTTTTIRTIENIDDKSENRGRMIVVMLLFAFGFALAFIIFAQNNITGVKSSSAKTIYWLCGGAGIGAFCGFLLSLFLSKEDTRTWIPCPKCHSTDVKINIKEDWLVLFCNKMINHVQCNSCQHMFHGKTGSDNKINRIIFIAIVITFHFLLLMFLLMPLEYM